MKMIALVIMLFAALGLVLAITPGKVEAASPEKLYVCGPCSSFFFR